MNVTQLPLNNFKMQQINNHFEDYDKNSFKKTA